MATAQQESKKILLWWIMSAMTTRSAHLAKIRDGSPGSFL